ncbi:MAG: preprotein translocase subunit SecE, partial [bacterium]
RSPKPKVRVRILVPLPAKYRKGLVSIKIGKIMDDIENPDASLPAPRAARFGEGVEGKGARRERGLSGRRVGPVGRMSHFLRDVRAEMKRVSWPTVKEVQNTTIITLVAVIFFAIYLFLVDRVWAYLLIGLNKLLLWMTGA